MRSALKRAGFSLSEMMISMVLFSIVIGGSMLAFNKFEKKTTQSSLMSEFALEGQQLSKLLSNDLKNAALISGSGTNAGTNFANTKTFGILPSPFADRSSLPSDGVQIFVVMPNLSTSSLFDIEAITPGGNCGTVRLSGDFAPTQSLNEDLIVMSSGTNSELFSVSGTISVTGTGSAQVSEFTLGACDATVIASLNAALGDTSTIPKVYRVQRITYAIGNGTETRGLYRSSNGEVTLISANAASMQVRYTLSTSETATSADCSTKSNSRWFAHAVNTSDCNWNKVVDVHAEIVLESSADMGVADNFNPHIPAVVDGKVRYTTHISAMPVNYTGAS
jgi:prepilin-type N-terminal cleavage/methylation domain-containing protein